MNKKKIPHFENEKQERRFWRSHDSSEYIDWSRAKKINTPGLKPSLKNISLRLPVFMIEQLKLLAHKKDIPYQSLLKAFLAERISKELR